MLTNLESNDKEMRTKMKNKIKEGFWANEIPMTEKEKKEVELLHKAGCKCELPLLGHIPGEGVRCRMCGVEVK